MNNKRNSFIKKLKVKFPNFSLIGVLGKISLTCVFLWYANSTYKKMQFKNVVADLEKNDIYESSDQIDKKKKQTNLKIYRLIFYSKYLKFLVSPIFFIQVKKSAYDERDLHLHYYKLYDHVRSVGKNFSLSYVILDKLSSKEKEKLKDYLKLNNIEELNKLSYFVTNSNGEPIPVFVDEENLESVKRFVDGIPKFNSMDQFAYYLTRQSDEAIQIISTGHNNTAHNVVKTFFTNSCLFSKNTFNFLINSTGLTWHKLNNKLQDKNEILIMINPKYYILNDFLDRKNNNAYIYDKVEEQLIPIDVFLDKNKGDNLNLNLNRHLLCFKYTIQSNSANQDDELKKFVGFVEYLIDPTSDKENNNSNINNTDNTSAVIPERIFLTNNLELANYYKLRLFNKKEKYVFVYINLKNFNKSNLNVDEATKFFLDSITNYKQQNKSNLNTPCNYIITHNPSIAKSFNIIPKSNENIAIRFVDYSSLVLFNEKNEYKLLKNNEIKDLENYDRNKMYYYKSKYAEKTLNHVTFVKSLENFFRNEKEYRKDNPHYLESFSDFVDDEDSAIKSLNGDSFKEKVLNTPGKKIVYTVSDNCVGCVKTKQIIEQLYENRLHKENVQIFEYDTMNESIYFKKIKNNPKLFLYENSKLLAEIDVKKVLEFSENNYDAISKELKNVFKL